MKLTTAALILEFCLTTSGYVTQMIIGGSPAEEGQFPYMVSIQVKPVRHRCGGAIIHSRWIVTSHHCIEDDMNDYVESDDPPYKVVLGTINFHHGLNYSIAKAIKYPRGNDKYHLYDIGMIKVKERIEFDGLVNKIEISDEDIKEGVNVVLSGW